MYEGVVFFPEQVSGWTAEGHLDTSSVTSVPSYSENCMKKRRTSKFSVRVTRNLRQGKLGTE